MKTFGIIGVLLLIASPLVWNMLFSTVESPVTVDPKAIEAMTTFEYTDWAEVLTLVDDQGRVDYQKLSADRSALDRFVATIAVVGPTTRPELFPNRGDKLAYYINAYNALTLFNVINRLPKMKSVHDDSKDFFYFTTFQLDGSSISLYKLENDIVRPEFEEPRVHFALNCASAGCPRLPSAPFLPGTLEAQLARETTRFLHETRNVRLDDGQVALSQIFEWYAEDFKPTPLAWIQAQATDLGLPADAKVTHTPYDWALNQSN